MNVQPSRGELESQIFADVRSLAAESELIGRGFAALHALSHNDFRALLFIMVADESGRPLTSGQLRRKMGLSGAAITYLVERMIARGHVSRASDPTDRRKVILRYADDGLAVARAFFAPLTEHSKSALARLSDEDLAAAHRVFVAMLGAMHSFGAELSASTIESD